MRICGEKTGSLCERKCSSADRTTCASAEIYRLTDADIFERDISHDVNGAAHAGFCRICGEEIYKGEAYAAENGPVCSDCIRRRVMMLCDEKLFEALSLEWRRFGDE